VTLIEKPLGLNAVGKPYSSSFDPNYKLKGVRTSTALLRSPYFRMKFVGEELREYRRQQSKLKENATAALTWKENTRKSEFTARAPIGGPALGAKAKERVNTMIVRDWLVGQRPDHALIERAGSMPKQGVASTFKYARAVGSLETVVACLDIPYSIIEPAVWKKISPPARQGQRSRAPASVAAFSA
jgi:hypothetical protein